MLIRPANSTDNAAIWTIMEPTIRAGETYALDREMSEAEAIEYWVGPGKEAFVAEVDGTIAGTYFFRANQPGGGSHVANCGFMVSPTASGKGVARAMCEHALAHAKAKGFRAIQFNFVVSTNERAVRLWQLLGFDIVGTLPGAFRHPTKGFVDVFVMYRTL